MDGELWIGVLGPVTVQRNAPEPVSLSTAERTVLCSLVLAGGSPVTTDSLIDRLWAGTAPATCTGIVHTYVSRLRRFLGPAAHGSHVQRIVRQYGGYRLTLANDELDVLSFRSLVAMAQDAAAQGKATAACALYEQALDLWRGEPMADIAAFTGHPALAALASERSAAVLAFADAASLSGQHDTALPHLRALTARNPFDETAQSRLMALLAESGRQAEALITYDDVRRRLADELGIGPGPMLREVHASILSEDAGVRVSPAADTPTPFQMPAAVADFTGRTAEVAALSAFVAGADADVGVPVAVVCGPPGVGKTSLVLQVAHKLQARFPDGQLWIHAAGTSSSPVGSNEALGEFLRAIGVHGSAIPSTTTERAAYYRSQLAGRQVLVVIDDAASAEQVRPLIPGSAGCAVLVTSRLQLTSLDGARIVPLQVLPSADAVSLLDRVVGWGRVQGERDAAESLVEACGALPLALRIAGAKLAARPSWPVALMTRRLLDANTRLQELETGDMSVRASIESSYQSLSQEAALAFRLLALAGHGDFAAWVVAALLGETDASGVIRELEARSLLTAVGMDATGEPRFRLHDLLRDFARQRLDDHPPDAREQALRRLLDGWLQLVVAADSHMPKDRNFPDPPPYPVNATVLPEAVHRLTADSVAWFASERASLKRAVDVACQAGLLDLARQLISRQASFLSLQYRYDEVERHWTVLNEWCERGENVTLARWARLHTATARVLQGRPSDAWDQLDRCVGELSETDDLAFLMSALEWRATCSNDLEDYESAVADAERALALAGLSGSREAQQRALNTLATCLAIAGQAERAIHTGEEALRLARELDSPTQGIASRIVLVQALCKVGRFSQAIAAGLRGVEVSRELTDLEGEALTLGVLGDAYRQQGSYREAIEHLLLALPIFRDRGSRRYYGVCLYKLGMTYAAQGSPKAVGYFEESIQVFGELRITQRVKLVQAELDQFLSRAKVAPGA